MTSLAFQQVLERLQVSLHLSSARSLQEPPYQSEEAPQLYLRILRQACPTRRLLEGESPLRREWAARISVRVKAVGLVGRYLEGHLESTAQKLGGGSEPVALMRLGFCLLTYFQGQG